MWQQRRLELPSSVTLSVKDGHRSVPLPRSVHIVHKGREAIISFLNHGIMYVRAYHNRAILTPRASCWDLVAGSEPPKFCWKLLPRSARM